MKYEDYLYVAKELATRHKTIKELLDTAEDDIIKPNEAKTLLSDYYIAIGELKMLDDNKMKYIFDINHFRIQPVEDGLMKAKLPKSMNGIMLSSLLEEDEKNPLHWYDEWKSGKTYYEIANELGRLDQKTQITKKIKAIDNAINELKYRELVL